MTMLANLSINSDDNTPLKRLAHPARFELTTSAFGVQRSIQLSYGCLNADAGGANVSGKRSAMQRRYKCSDDVLRM